MALTETSVIKIYLQKRLRFCFIKTPEMKNQHKHSPMPFSSIEEINNVAMQAIVP
jgi:hypothetical protein